MKKKYAGSAYALSALVAIALGTVLAIALAGGTDAQQDNNGYNGGQYEKDNRHSVPDNGSTAALLGSSVAIIVLAKRKFA
jgi:VPDSG-CTERM motif